MTRQRRRNIIRARRTGTGIALVAAISFIAGMTDAVGLHISGDFVSFMTGNTTRAAVSAQAGLYPHAAKLLFAIVAFVAGNAGGIMVAHKFERRIFAVLLGVGSLVAIAALLRGEATALAQFYLVVFAMGMVNAAVEHIEGLPIGLTYVTGALSRFGRGIGRFLLGDRSLDWGIQIVPWLGMLSGAICGAILGATLQSDALWVVAGAVFAVAIATLIIPRSLRQRYNQRVKIRRIAP
ncbi:YoaK family protein [Agrobacterium sp. SOY23]|uniref:YoaK family protein n=1 Tax=Agrobacterium sp. SOY23 TaxID=3014555 RepID=UPI0022AE70C0|nr:YoaK family protein [Agrobacterium sp. SOY23]MCZ4429174.1 YoaK family protein [Agrobacterium sp. SOY23]